MIQPIYGYAIDLAQNLNFCGITVVKIQHKVYLQTLRKFNKIQYPVVKSMLVNNLFPKYPPTYICTDYTSEKSFSEELETILNPVFSNPYHREYNKWRFVEPITYTVDKKLEMMQNARKMLEYHWFTEPKQEGSPPHIWALWEELKEQMYRVVANPLPSGKYKFPKPEGHDDDLLQSFIMNLWKAREFLGEMNPNQESVIVSVSEEDVERDPNIQFMNYIRERTKGMDVSDVEARFNKPKETYKKPDWM